MRETKAFFFFTAAKNTVRKCGKICLGLRGCTIYREAAALLQLRLRRIRRAGRPRIKLRAVQPQGARDEPRPEKKLGGKKIPPKAGQIVSAARFCQNSEAAALPQLQLRRIRRAELQRTLRPLPPAGRAARPPRPLHLRCHSTSAAEQRRLPAPHRPLCSPGLFLQLSRCSANYRLDSVHLPCNRSSPARRAT